MPQRTNDMRICNVFSLQEMDRPCPHAKWLKARQKARQSLAKSLLKSLA